MHILSLLLKLLLTVYFASSAFANEQHLEALCSKGALLNASYNSDGLAFEGLMDPSTGEDNSFVDSNTHKFYDSRFKYCEDFYPEISTQIENNNVPILGDRKALLEIFNEVLNKHNFTVIQKMATLNQAKCDSDPSNWKDLHKVVSYIGETDYRKTKPSPMYEHIFYATGNIVGYNKGKSGNIRHTAFICEHDELLCASYHSVCDGRSEVPGHDTNKFIPDWMDRDSGGVIKNQIDVDMSQSWLGKMGKDKNGNPCKIYGKCPLGVDEKIPVFLRLKQAPKIFNPKIRPLKLQVLDPNQFKITKGMSSEQKKKVLEYYKKINENLVVVEYHDERSIPIHDQLKKDRNLKYIQESGFEFIPLNENIDGDWFYDAPVKVDFKHVLLTSGFLTPESSGSPNGQCQLVNGKSECFVTAIHGGQITDCYNYGNVSSQNTSCLNVSQAISQNFKNEISKEVNRINMNQPQIQCN